jgi:vacuolar-type H+-ATPase subunit D/Vma8
MLRLVAVAVVLLAVAPAWAEDADLEQTISDLGSQAGDKERIDALGAAKVEINQIRGWLTDASNAVKQSHAKKARRVFDFVRAEMKLVERLIAVSQLENEAARLERDVAQTKREVAALKDKLIERRTELRVAKTRDAERPEVKK